MKRSAMKLGLELGAIFLAIVAVACAEEVAIDVQRSTITIHVGKAGMLSAAGHDHWINAPISSGTLAESPAPHVEFTVETAKMTGGYMMCIGNHIPWNVPPEAIKRYLDLSAQLAHR